MLAAAPPHVAARAPAPRAGGFTSVVGSSSSPARTFSCQSSLPVPQLPWQTAAARGASAALAALAAARALGRRARRRGGLAGRGARRAGARRACRKGADWIGGIVDIADSYDAFLVDLWGVVHNGSVAFPWALRALEELCARGKPVVFLSNSSRRREVNAAALERLGVARDLYADLVTSGDEAWQALAGRAGPLAEALPSEILGAERVLTLGNAADDAEYLAGLAPRRRSAPAEEAELVLARGCSTICDGEGAPRKASWEELEKALEVAARRKVPMLVANPDSVRPDGADSPMPGRLASRYAELGGPEPHFIGKPYRAVFDAAGELLRGAGVPSGARVCMVGDSAWHDVRGARGAGLDVVLLCTGVHSSALGLRQAPSPPARPSAERLEAFLGALALEEQPSYVSSAFTWDDPCAAAPSGEGAPEIITCGLACLDLVQRVGNYPEPDDKVRAEETRWLGGGNAANTACALSRLGSPAALVSKIGDDALGDVILEGLQVDGVDTRFLERAPASTSAFTTVLVDTAGQTRTCINSPMSKELGVEEAQRLLASPAGPDGPCGASGLLGNGTRLLHLDCRHPKAAVEIAEAARGLEGIRISIDVERKREGLDRLLPLCDAIFCNSSFPQAWTGASGLPGALAQLLDEFPRASFAVATRGARGSLLLARKSPELDLGAGVLEAAGVPLTCCLGSFGSYSTVTCDAWPLPEEASVRDGTGAGDVFIAGVLHAWLAGKPLSACLATGSFVAASKLQQLGARLGPDFDAEALPFDLGP